MRHGYFGRQGGVSTGIFSSLNCGVGSGDAEAAVRENRTRVAAGMDCAAERLLTMKQVHSPRCLTIESAYDSFTERPEADALVTAVPGLALGVLTADCAPVLFHASTAAGRPLVGVAHAGWGGALGGVLENTVKTLLQAGAVPDSIHASIGPCINPESYEVANDFMKPFLAQDAENGSFFAPGKDGTHKMFDLPAYCARRLRLAGVTNISGKGLDTVFNEEDFFSYRRATHRQEPDYGRQVSVAMISR